MTDSEKSKDLQATSPYEAALLDKPQKSKIAGSDIAAEAISCHEDDQTQECHSHDDDTQTPECHETKQNVEVCLESTEDVEESQPSDGSLKEEGITTTQSESAEITQMSDLGCECQTVAQPAIDPSVCHEGSVEITATPDAPRRQEGERLSR